MEVEYSSFQREIFYKYAEYSLNIKASYKKTVL